jgi:hypothetical protein
MRGGVSFVGPPPAAGAAIMAAGIFGAVALQRLPSGPQLTAPVAVILTIAWAAIAFSIVAAAARSGLTVYTAAPVGSFAVGTWVAATAVVGRVDMLGLPAVPGLAGAMFALSGVLWLWFAPQAGRNLVRIATAHVVETRPTGLILLATVATQAVALLMFRFLPQIAAARLAATALVGIGILCYAAGTALIVRRYLAGPQWRLANDWDNANCILHGALSITGLAMVVGDVAGIGVLAPYWVMTLAVFATVEAIEAARLTARLRLYGWRDGVLVYDTSQWARNFTFGMFYAFTAALAGRFGAAAFPFLGGLSDAILAVGQYVVLLLLVAELGLLGLTLAGRIRTAASCRRGG